MKNDFSIRQRATSAAVLAALVLCGTAYAVSTKNLGDFTAKDFAAGEKQEVYVDEEGQLRLASEETELLTGVDHAWCAVVAEDGTVYVGTVPEGEVYRVKDGKSEVFFETGEAGVFSLALDREGRLFAGTGSEGKVWRVSPDGAAELLADLDENYVYALAVEHKGTVLAATGGKREPEAAEDEAAGDAGNEGEAEAEEKEAPGAEKAPDEADGEDGQSRAGRIYRLGGREAELVFESPSEHLTALAVGPDGWIYAGSGDRGAVYRVGAGGEGEVLFSAPEKVVQALLLGGDGSVYAGTGAISEDKPGAEAAAVKSILNRVQARQAAAPLTPTPPAPPARRTYKVTNCIWRVWPGGEVRRIWSVKGALVLTLLFSDDRVLAGTGGKPGIYSVAPDGSSAATLYEGESNHVHFLAGHPAGGFVAGFGMPGRVVHLGRERARKGEFTSRVLDAGNLARWGRMSWELDAPMGTKVTFKVRSGNSPAPEATWTEWRTLETGDGEAQSGLPPSRYAQYAAALATASGAATPVVKSVSIAALPINLSPVVSEVTAGAKPASQSNSNSGGNARTKNSGGSDSGADAPLSGTVVVSWKAEDGNGDKMEFELAFRDAAMERFIALEDELTTAKYSWDTTSVPDGRYYFRVKASDAPSNPKGTELESEKAEGPFTVDNTAPAVGAPKVSGRGGALRIEVTARDAGSTLKEAYWSVDGGEWRALMPVDGIFDSQSEKLAVVVEKEDAAIVVIRVIDSAGNSAAVKALSAGER